MTPADWLNDGVKGFLPGPDRKALVVLESPGMVVRTASPEYLLALKVLGHENLAPKVQYLVHELFP